MPLCHHAAIPCLSRVVPETMKRIPLSSCKIQKREQKRTLKMSAFCCCVRSSKEERESLEFYIYEFQMQVKKVGQSNWKQEFMYVLKIEITNWLAFLNAWKLVSNEEKKNENNLPLKGADCGIVMLDACLRVCVCTHTWLFFFFFWLNTGKWQRTTSNNNDNPTIPVM